MAEQPGPPVPWEPGEEGREFVAWNLQQKLPTTQSREFENNSSRTNTEMQFLTSLLSDTDFFFF